MLRWHDMKHFLSNEFKKTKSVIFITRGKSWYDLCYKLEDQCPDVSCIADWLREEYQAEADWAKFNIDNHLAIYFLNNETKILFQLTWL